MKWSLESQEETMGNPEDLMKNPEKKKKCLTKRGRVEEWGNENGYFWAMASFSKKEATC